MIRVGRDRETYVARARRQELTYPEVGQTRATELPGGYRHDRLTRRVGQGIDDWERAKEAIRLWKAHAHAGIAVTPPDTPIQQGATVVVGRAFGPVSILAPCRIVYVTDEPTRYGFGYGTLPGHPVTGEEAFHVILGADGTVTAEILAFSKAALLSTRFAGPLAPVIQRAATKRYLGGIAKHVAAGR